MDGILGKIVGPFVRRNFARSIGRDDVAGFIERTNGRIFTVVFSRRSDGRQRIMNCRTGVAASLSGKGMVFEPADRNLAVVYDMKKREYRCIPLDRVLCIKLANVNYRIEANHDHAYAQRRRVA